jgi:hypothetical protein
MLDVEKRKGRLALRVDFLFFPVVRDLAAQAGT